MSENEMPVAKGGAYLDMDVTAASSAHFLAAESPERYDRDPPQKSGGQVI